MGTLTEPPSKMRKLIGFLTTPSPVRRVMFYGLGVLFVIGFVLFVMDRCTSWRSTREADKLKANVNAAIANIEARNAVIANLKEQQAVETQQLKDAAEQYLESQNSTNSAREETNKAIERMKNAANGNGNVSVKEFEEKLKGL